MSTQFPLLFKPFRLGQLELKNRIVMPPMLTNYGSDDGFVTEQLKDYYVARARGGVGLVIVEATCVDAPVGRSLEPRQPFFGERDFMQERWPVYHPCSGSIRP